MHNFRKLKVWNRAMEFVSETYKVSACYPRAEQFGLTNQIRRAAISIPLNIAEGSGGSSNAEFSKFLGYALRSTYEVMTALDISERLGYCSSEGSEGMQSEADEIAAMIFGLSRSLV
jgi:four helix bundle protein